MNLTIPVYPNRGIGLILLLFAFICSFEAQAGELFSSGSPENIVTDCTSGDVVPPTASNPATINSECSAPSPDPEVVTDEADDCPGTITVAFVSDVSNNASCPETVTRTYSVTDAAGNSINVFQTIIINDLTQPALTCPPNLSVNWGEDTSPAATGTATVTDNCTADPDVLFIDTNSGGNCPVAQVIQRTWASVDDCGNTSLCQQTISIIDDEAPVITCPSDITIEWGSSILPEDTGEATAIDNADQDVDITYSDNEIVTGTCPEVRIVERTWIATDDCGNSTSCLQLINGTDNTPPTLNCPPDINIEWGEDDQPVNTGQATTTDNADSSVDLIFNDNLIVTGSCPAVNIIERTWTATDDCGLSTTCMQIININDTTDPVITCPASSPGGPVEVDETEPNNISADPGVLTLSNESTISGAIGPVTTDPEDHWFIQDGLSGSFSMQFNFSLQPLTIAALTCYTDQARTIVANSQSILPFDPPLTVNLDGNLYYSIVVQNPLASGQGYEINVSGAAFPPVPGSTVLECPTGFNTLAVGPNTPQDPIIDPSITGIAIATDNCGNPTISYQDVLTGPNPENCPEVLIVERTWTATDDCGLTSSCVETFIFTDTTDPVIICPPTIDISFGTDDQPATTGSPTLSDNCDANLDMVFTDNLTITGACPVIQIIERTFVVGDDCGNTSNCTQTINVTDLENPIIICPPDVDLECGEDDQPDSTGWATGTDNADPNVTISFFDEVTLPAVCPVVYQIERNWSATDACGNKAECIQIITVSDILRPVISCPSDIMVECGSSIDPMDTGNASATDGCDTPSVTFSDSMIPGCGNTQVINRLWTATDVCGNIDTCTQVITILDTTSPSITCPSDQIVECGSSLDPIDTGSPTGMDACGNVQFSFSDNTVISCGLAGSLSRVWTVTDDCGNTSNCTQTITINDTSPPSISCPQAMTVECGDSIDPASTGQPSGSDNCGIVQFSFSDSNDPGCGQTMVITRTWTAMDECGNNSNNCTQEIIIEDNSPPLLSCPPDITVECGNSTDPSSTGTPTASDACGNVSTGFTDDTTPGCGQTFIISRTWTVTDECGNSSTCLQTITVEDTTPPVISCPPDITMECGDNLDPVNTGSPIATDGCGFITIAFIDTQAPGNCGLNEIITRTWFAVDACNNVAQCVQIITLEDTSPPAISCPADITVNCGDSTDPSETGEPTGMDNCGSVVFSFMDSTTAGCGLTTIISRIWTATDDCGNTSGSCTQTITIEDSNPPIIVCPVDISIECGMPSDPSATGMATATDDCGNTAITFSDSSDPGCGLTSVITRTWTATDDCGNSVSCQQIITIEDTTFPTITCPADITIGCGESTDPMNTGSAGAVDECSSVTIGFSDTAAQGCGMTQVITRTWFAIDGCSNVEQCTQTITITDQTPPAVTCVDITISLDKSGFAMISVSDLLESTSDNCGSVVLSVSNAEFGCSDTGDNQVTLTATDECGLSSNCTSTVTVINPNPIEITASITDQLGPVEADGAIDLSVSGGFPPYDFSWSNGATDEDISGLVSDEYIVTVSDAAGCKGIDTFFVDQGILVPVEYCLTVYLQGLFNPFAIDPAPPLRTTLNDLDLLSLGQPFNIVPWNYAGTESYANQAAIDTDISDWVLLTIRSGADPTQIIAREAAVLRSDGTVTSIDGSLPAFLLDPSQSYWVEIDHQNHLPVSSPIPFPVNPLELQICHDFTISEDQAFIDNQISNSPMLMQNSLSGPAYCMISGNALFADLQIDINDLNQIFIHYQETLVYAPWDINLDGFVDINDINQISWFMD